MENALMLNATPLQLTIALALHVWLFVIFPIIIIRKLNYIAAMLQEQFYSDKEASSQG